MVSRIELVVCQYEKIAGAPCFPMETIRVSDSDLGDFAESCERLTDGLCFACACCFAKSAS